VFVFDSAGNRTAEEWLNAQGQVTATMTYQYDANNRLTSEQDPNSSYAFTYDGIGELTKVDNLGTPNAPRMWLTFSYDAFGNVLKITDSSSGGFPAISYGYDQDNNLALAQFKTFGNGRARLYYDQSDRLTTVTRDGGNGGASIQTVWSYDNADRVTGITHSSSSAGALATFTYGFDQASQLTSYTGPEGSLTYTYDNASELTGVGNARSESYSYDLNGNRNMTGWSTGGNNRLTGDGTFTYAYDNEGNLLSKTRLSDSQQWTFTWDYRNRLTQAVVKTSVGVTVANDIFTYDVEDQRIGKSTNGTQTWTFYKDHNPYADFNGSGTLVYRYLYGKGLDQLLGRDDGTASKWYLTDNIGSVRLFVTTAGTILDQLSYDSYGNILTETNSANGDRFKYTARDWDSEIGVQYNRERYYDPKAGRWLSLDPRGLSAESNLYRYAGNDPTVYTDPAGLTTQKVRAAYMTPTGFAEQEVPALGFGPSGLKPKNNTVILIGGRDPKTKPWDPDYVDDGATYWRYYSGLGRAVVYGPGVNGRSLLIMCLKNYPPHSISDLIVVGHGFGCGITGAFNPWMDEDLAAYLRMKLQPDATVRIISCEAAASDTQMKRMAIRLQATIIANEGDTIYYTDPNGKKPPVLSGQRRWRVLRPPTTDPTDYPATPWDGQVVIPP
jgi:RHS repeat-associated protein